MMEECNIAVPNITTWHRNPPKCVYWLTGYQSKVLCSITEGHVRYYRVQFKNEHNVISHSITTITYI